MESKTKTTLRKFFLPFIFALLGSSCIYNIDLGIRGYAPLSEVTLLGEGKEKILLINISGVISWEDIRESRGLFTVSEPSIVSRIREELDKAEKDQNIKAIVFKVSSPGGLVSASEAIYNEIKNFKEKKKIPIVAYISTLGVSGSYYVILPSDKIVANPASTVGSIGVYAMKLNVEKLADKVGVEFEIVKGGAHKDMLLFHRKMTEEEREKFQKLIDYYYDIFKKRVVEWRGNKLKKPIDEIADGIVFSPETALSLGLIDEIGDIYKAIDSAAKIAGLKSWKLISYTRKGQNLPSIWTETYGKHDLSVIKNILNYGEFLILYIWPGEL
ncbi:Putative signal peptide peptidase SppA [bacterium HR19]|nr:Putative signal peptide peptidase SppA [bacterium HR19]